MFVLVSIGLGKKLFNFGNKEAILANNSFGSKSVHSQNGALSFQ